MNMSGQPRKRSLFTREDGGPMCFSLMPCPERKEIRELIQYGGGVLVQPDRKADAIRLVPSFIATATDDSDDVFSVNYIRACSENNKLYPLKDFKVPTSPTVPDDSKQRTLCSVRSRREYTLGEDMAIAKFIAERPGVRVRGNAVYQEMAAAKIVSGKHSWQSLKQRYLKTIQPMRHLYEPPGAASSVDKRCSRRDTPEQHIIVEDSDSDDVSPKRKRTSARELQSSEDSGAEAEDVEETESQTTPPPGQPGTSSPKETKADERKRPNRNSSSMPLVAGGCEGESKAGEKGDRIKSAKRRQDPGEAPARKLKLQASLWRARERTPHRSTDDTTRAQSRRGIDSGAARATGRKTVVTPPPPFRSNKQETLPTTPKTSKKGVPGSPTGHACAQAHARSVEINSDSELEVSPSVNRSALKGTGHGLEAHRDGRPERAPSPGNARPPTRSSPRKRGRPKLAEKSVKQLSMELRPSSRTANDGACETDLENRPRPACDAEGLNLPNAPSLGSRKKGVPSPRKSSEKQTQPSEKEVVPPKEKRKSSRLRLQAELASSVKGSGGVRNFDSSITSVPNSGCTPERLLLLSPSKERQKGTSPPDPGGRSSNSVRLKSGHSSNKLSEADPPKRARTSEGSKFRTLSKSPKKRGAPSLPYGRSNSTEQASTEELEKDTSMGTGTLSHIRKQSEPPSSSKSIDKVPDVKSSAMSSVESTRSPERAPSQGRKLHNLRLSVRKQVGTPLAESNRHSSTESSSNNGAASETDSEDPLGRSLLRAKLVQDQSKAKGVLSWKRGSNKWVARLEKRESSLRTSALRKQSRPAGGRGTKPAVSAADKEEGTDVGHFDSADELLLERATRRVPDSPIALDSADEDLLARVTGPYSDCASTVTLSSERSMPDTISIRSSSECSEEDVAAESGRDSFSSERQKLGKLLGVVKEGKEAPPHASAACPLDCRCPRSTEYIRMARAAAALGALLAYHDRPLPSDCPGAKDPRVALLLEVLLRRLEGGDADDHGSS